MATPRIPTGLRPSIQRYGYGAPTGLFMTEVGGALPRPGRRWRRGTATYSTTMVLTRVQMNVWNAFYFGIIDQGAVQFTYPLDTQGGVLEDHLCVMIPSSYRVEPVSGSLIWNVSFDVVAEPSLSSMTAAEAQAIIDLWSSLGNSSEAIMDALSEIATVRLTQIGADWSS